MLLVTYTFIWECGGISIVVYFDQQTGAPHAVRWSKSFYDAKTTFSVNFYDKMFKKSKK